MKIDAGTYAIAMALIGLIALPLLIYASSDVPRCTQLKEFLSILSLLSFSLMLSQFFMARSNTVLRKLFKPVQIQKVHKIIAYGAVGLMLLLPYLIVFPRYFESGVQPWDAFITMISSLTWSKKMAGHSGHLGHSGHSGLLGHSGQSGSGWMRKRRLPFKRNP